MATDDVNITEDAEMAECDGDKVVTMLDVLQEQQDFEEDANAVLGASDDKNCTYPKGYIKRQALYACLTCCTEAKVDPTKRAGVCLACSLTCHENHELIELYTKRNFRCDCGNPKFNSHPCQFTSDKTELNNDNIYNQNFSGLYCTCQRPYPDPESTIEDDMIQCIICEDWLHASHLEAVVPANDQYSEMVCKSCMEKNEFLHDYSMFAVTVEAGDVDILTVNGDSKSDDNSLCNGDLEKEKLINGIEENQTEIEATCVNVNGDIEMDEAKGKSEDKAKDDTNNEKDEESLPSETKQDELGSTESMELKPEENTKPNTDDIQMDLDTESKIAEQEQSIDTTEIKEQNEDTSEKSNVTENTPTAYEKPAEKNEVTSEKSDATESIPIANEKPAEKNEDNSDATESIPIANEKPAEINEDTSDKSDATESIPTANEKPVEINEDTSDKSDATESIPIANEKPAEINEDTSEKSDATESTTDNEKPAEQNEDITNENMECTGNKPEKTDETKEYTETQEQITKLSTKEDGDIAQENETDTNERTEQQLLDDLTALTSDNTTSDEKTDTAAEEKAETAMDENPLESMEQSEDNKEKAEVETNTEEASQETANKSGDKSEEKPAIENESATGNIEVPDTSQTEKDVKENDEEKADSVMDAIDELLQTANEAKENESAEETKEPTSESSESKETTENVETKESMDVEMSASENKVPEKEDEIADTNDKPSANTDLAMDTQNEPTNESKVEPTHNSESTEEKSEVDDSVMNDSIIQENVALKTDDKSETLNETDCGSKTIDDNDSTNKTEPSKDENEVPSATENTKEHKRKLSTDATDDISPKKVKLECVRPKNVKRVHKGATFWPSNFRQKLCTCGECLSMYKDLKVLFLTDLEDTVFAYESLGKENVAGGASQYEKGMQALSSLDRIQQINALTEYNKMRDKLLDFLKSFKDRKEIVKEEDIKAFFAGMKPRREPDGVYFCR